MCVSRGRPGNKLVLIGMRNCVCVKGQTGVINWCLLECVIV